MQQQLTLTQQHRNALEITLEEEREYVSTVLNQNQAEDFKANYLELAQNNYLLKEIPLKEILITAVNATALGININPIYKECYILPFNTKGRGMVASIVIAKDGHAQMAFNSGFYLTIDRVWGIDDDSVAESEMTRKQLSKLKTTDFNFVKANLHGWEITLEDISDAKMKVPKQTKFVGLEFVMEATKQLQMQQYAIQTYTHKAVRRAMGDMFIPRNRKSMSIEKIEEWNNRNETNTYEQKPIAEPIDQTQEYQEAEMIETVEDPTEVTVKDINAFYRAAKAEDQVKIGEEIQKYNGWREFTPKQLETLLLSLRKAVEL